ncbi:MAG: hypothetical protein Q7R79_01125 [bacterium]|nr:hypothetical protein [bacterium]
MDRIIFGIVGPSGCGKTEVLIIPVTEHIGHAVGAIRTYTTREWRHWSDDYIYDFTSDFNFKELITNGEMIQEVLFGKSRYGNTFAQVQRILSQKHGVIALTEEGVHNFKGKGYSVKAVKIVPVGIPPREGNAQRKADDEARALIPVDYSLVIENHFGDEGKARAQQQLIDFILSFPLS